MDIFRNILDGEYLIDLGVKFMSPIVMNIQILYKKRAHRFFDSLIDMAKLTKIAYYCSRCKFYFENLLVLEKTHLVSGK